MNVTFFGPPNEKLGKVVTPKWGRRLLRTRKAHHVGCLLWQGVLYDRLISPTRGYLYYKGEK